MKKTSIKAISTDTDAVVRWIVKNRRPIEKAFMIIFFISLICFPLVKVNYDLSKYLPKTAPSKVGLDILEEEFGYPGTARVMVGEVSIYEAKAIKNRIEDVEGVDMVTWLDQTVEVYEANSFIETKDIEDYYKDGYAVMDIVFDEGDSSKLTHKAIDEIKKITGDKGSFAGTAIDNKSLNDTLTREIALAMALAVVMILAILCATTTSWFEPILFLMVIGIAIVINMGTNIFLGEISFFTFSVAAILQLAIAMDYSIFLLHTFAKEKLKTPDQEEAMAISIKKSSISILSSGATTIVGFLALALMKFSIGKDMGIVLAKGIVISLFAVIFLMPSLILRLMPKIEKTEHKSFMPPFKRLGTGMYKIKYVVMLVVGLLVLPAYVGQGMNSFLYGNDALGSSEGTVTYEDTRKINERFGRSNLVIVLVPNGSIIKEKQLSDELEDLEIVKYVTSLAGTLPPGVSEDFLPKNLTSKLRSEHYGRLLISVKTAGESDLAFETIDKITGITKKYYDTDYHIVGLTPSTIDIKDTINHDYSVVNILSLIGVGIVVAITFKSIIIPILLLIPIEIAIFINMALPYLGGHTMIFMGYIIVSCLQLGATIDYAILLTNNYLNNRPRMEKKDAFIKTVSQSALSILTSGGILTSVGYGLYFTSTVSAIATIGRLVGRGAFFSVILVMVLLPTLLMLCDKLIFKNKKGGVQDEEN